MIAPAFTVRHPERVRALGIVSGVAGRTPEQRAAVVKRADELARGGASTTVGAAIERWFTPEFRTGTRRSSSDRIQRVLGNDPVGYAAAYRVFAESDPIDELGKISCPTLVMTGRARHRRFWATREADPEKARYSPRCGRSGRCARPGAGLG